MKTRLFLLFMLLRLSIALIDWREVQPSTDVRLPALLSAAQPLYLPAAATAVRVDHAALDAKLLHNVYEQQRSAFFGHFGHDTVIGTALHLTPPYLVKSLPLRHVMQPGVEGGCGWDQAVAEIRIGDGDQLRPAHNPKVYRYWSGKLEELGDSLVQAMAEVVPRSDMDAHRRGWASNGGVTAGLHYDLFHNTFVMVEGSKRFTLLAPAAINVAHLHPSLHPGYRQSQWVNVTAEVEPLADTLPLWQITLSAVLYLPPLWLHHVEALEPGVAVNVWRREPRLQKAEGIFKLPVPFEEAWTLVQVAHALGPLIGGIVKEFEHESPRTWVDHLLAQRFYPVQKISGNWSKSMLEDENCLCCNPSLAHSLGLEARVQTMIGRLSPLLAELDAITRRLYLQDYVEELVSFLLGFEYVVPLLEKCIS